MKIRDMLSNIGFTTRDFLVAQNSLVMPTGNLGIPRHQMPQIKDFNGFVKILKKYDIKVSTSRLRIGDIKLTQNEINKDKVFKLMTEYRSVNRRSRGGVDIKGFPPVITSDKYVLDGSHRQVAMHNINRHAYQTYSVIEAPVKKVIALIRDNPSVFKSVVVYRGL